MHDEKCNQSDLRFLKKLRGQKDLRTMKKGANKSKIKKTFGTKCFKMVK